MKFLETLEQIKAIVRDGCGGYLPGATVPHIDGRVNEALKHVPPGDIWYAISGPGQDGIYRVVRSSPALLERLVEAGFVRISGAVERVVDCYVSAPFVNPPKMRRDSSRKRHKIDDLMAEMPDGLPMVEGWETMPPEGREDD